MQKGFIQIPVQTGVVFIAPQDIVLAEFVDGHWVIFDNGRKSFVLSRRITMETILSWNEQMKRIQKNLILNTSYLRFIEFLTRRVELSIQINRQGDIFVSRSAYKEIVGQNATDEEEKSTD